MDPANPVSKARLRRLRVCRSGCARFDLVGFGPRRVASSRPAIRCNSDADNDRLQAEPQVDYSREGVAHIENETKLIRRSL